MVGVFIDDDVIAVPEPVIAEGDIRRGDAEIEAAEPKATGAASRQVPDMASTEATREAPVLPRVVEVVVRIVAPSVVADPLAIGMNVRCVRVPALVVVVTVFRRGMWIVNRGWPVGWNMPAPNFTVVLGKGGEGT
jgi:hypothetical protein